jgi:hypothetical protein
MKRGGDDRVKRVCRGDGKRQRGRGQARWCEMGGEEENLLVYVSGYAQLVGNPRVPALRRMAVWQRSFRV